MYMETDNKIRPVEEKKRSTNPNWNGSAIYWTAPIVYNSRPEVPARQDLMNELEAVRNRHLSSTWKLYGGVSAALAILRKKYRLALVSNCAAGTDKLIDSLGLADFFSCIILSYQVGVRKPDKRMYLEALSCLRLEAHACIFVADEISDLEGAREVGLKTMLVRQGLDTFQGAENKNFKPDSEISQISEITRLL